MLRGLNKVITSSSTAKLKVVQQEIIKESGNSKGDTIIADLLSLADTKRMADEIKTRYQSLDVLINNAGALFNKNREVTKEGFEKTIAHNLFSPFLLMNALLDLLAKSPSAIIINLSSAMHRRGGKPNFNDFQLVNSYKPARAYGLSKLYLIWVTKHNFSSTFTTNWMQRISIIENLLSALPRDCDLLSDFGMP